MHDRSAAITSVVSSVKGRSVKQVETLTHAGVTVTLVRTDAPGVIPARWYEARKYDVQYSVFLSRIADEQGERIGGVERFKTLVGAKPRSRGAPSGPFTRRQYKGFRWRYYTDDYAPATAMEYVTRRAALEDLLRNTKALSDLHRREIKSLSYVGDERR